MQPGAEAAKIMVVDGPGGRPGMASLLENGGFSTVSLHSGDTAFEILRRDPDDVDVLLVDQPIPKGMGLRMLAQVKQSPQLHHIPVIFHSPNAALDDIKALMRAGAYYYLVEPCDEELLLSVVQSAANDSVRWRTCLTELDSFRLAHARLSSGHMDFSTFEDAAVLANFFASLCPEPTRVLLGFTEILENAVEHGNLEIGYKRKAQLLREHRRREEIHRRQNLPRYKKRQVRLDFDKNPKELTLHVRDEGKGFDWKPYLSITMERLTDLNGRGIALANLVSFDHLEFSGDGNEAICTVKLG